VDTPDDSLTPRAVDSESDSELDPL